MRGQSCIINLKGTKSCRPCCRETELRALAEKGEDFRSVEGRERAEKFPGTGEKAAERLADAKELQTLMQQNECLMGRRFPHLLGQMAGPLRRVEDFIVEDREVEGQTQPDWVRGGQVNKRNVLFTRTALRQD